MELIIALATLAVALLGLTAGFFLVIVQPVWGIIDVAVSSEHSAITKVVVIGLTLVLLGPIMTFFYGCFGTKTRVFMLATRIAFLLLVFAGIGMVGLAATAPGVRDTINKWTDKSDTQSFDVQTAEHSMPTLAIETLSVPEFKAVHYVPISHSSWSVSIADFDLYGPLPDSVMPVSVPSIYPLNQIAIDPDGPRIYGITTHKVGRIILSTGKFVELDYDPALPEISWPSTIAFDIQNKILFIICRNGGFTYDPSTGEWKHIFERGRFEYYSMTYDISENVFYALVSNIGRDQAYKIAKLNRQGAIVSQIALSRPLSAAPLHDSQIQIKKPGPDIIILVSSHYQRRSGTQDRLVEATLYAVDPATGEIALIES